MTRRALHTLPAGTLVRLHRGLPPMVSYGVRGQAVVLGRPGALPHLVHHRPAARVEVVPA